MAELPGILEVFLNFYGIQRKTDSEALRYKQW